MSQVIVTQDKYEERRRKSAEQEKKIARDVMVHRRMSDPTKPDPVLKILGIVGLPILLAWSAIGAFIALVVTAFEYVMKGLGKAVGGARNLITGEKVEDR